MQKSLPYFPNESMLAPHSPIWHPGRRISDWIYLDDVTHLEDVSVDQVRVGLVRQQQRALESAEMSDDASSRLFRQLVISKRLGALPHFVSPKYPTKNFRRQMVFYASKPKIGKTEACVSLRSVIQKTRRQPTQGRCLQPRARMFEIHQDFQVLILGKR